MISSLSTVKIKYTRNFFWELYDNDQLNCNNFILPNLLFQTADCTGEFFHNELESAKRKLDKPDKSKNKKRRVGRPRRQPKIPDGVRSITTYFRSEWVNNYNVELKQ